MIFDLDETLLLANTASSLMTKIDEAQRTRRGLEMELSKFSFLSTIHPSERNPQDESTAEQLKLQIAATVIEVELLSEDLKVRWGKALCCD